MPPGDSPFSVKFIIIIIIIIIIPTVRSLCVYVSKDVRICGYFSKPKGVREQNRFGNTDINYTGTNSYLPLAPALCVLVVCYHFIPETHQKSNITYLISVYPFF
jgi:hypothetical protein